MEKQIQPSADKSFRQELSVSWHPGLLIFWNIEKMIRPMAAGSAFIYRYCLTAHLLTILPQYSSVFLIKRGTGKSKISPSLYWKCYICSIKNMYKCNVPCNPNFYPLCCHTVQEGMLKPFWKNAAKIFHFLWKKKVENLVHKGSCKRSWKCILQTELLMHLENVATIWILLHYTLCDALKVPNERKPTL